MISVIDYGAGNLRSVQKALEFLGFSASVTADRDEILSSDSIILPGVGAFGDCMKNLKERNLINCIYDAVDNKIPFMGICLGLQLMFEESEETPGVSGLGIFKGKIVKIPPQDGLKIPQMGWNSLDFPKKARIFSGLCENPFVYFVHSYYAEPTDREIIAATCSYSKNLTVALESENIFATQFHPEKSGNVGLKILKNFAEVTK